MLISNLIKILGMAAVAYFTPTKVDDVAVGIALAGIARDHLRTASDNKYNKARSKEAAAEQLIKSAAELDERGANAAMIAGGIEAAL